MGIDFRDRATQALLVAIVALSGIVLPPAVAPVVTLGGGGAPEGAMAVARDVPRFPAPLEIVDGYSDDMLRVDNTGTGDIAAFRDGGTDEFVIGQSLNTLTNEVLLVDDLRVGNGTPDVTQDGEDAYIEGTLEVDGAARFDGATTLGALSAIGTLSDQLLIDGDADVVLTVQDIVTPTDETMVIEDSSGTDVWSMGVARAAAGSFDFLDLTDTLAIQDGSDAVTGIDINITGANHTGSTNTIHGIDLDLTTPDAEADEIAIELSDTDWDAGIVGAAGLEHRFFPTVATASITYATQAGLFTIGAGEAWWVHGVVVEVTTNFDCSGDDCTGQIGDGNDANGLVDLVDAELQAAAVDVTGGAAGWHGYMADTRGAYLADGGGFVYDAADAIDFTMGGTSPSAGAATVYIIYTRVK